MKTYYPSLTGFLIVLLSACQSNLPPGESDEITDYKTSGDDIIHNYEISDKDAIKAFSHTPTGAIEVEGIKIDFSCNEDLAFQTSDKDFIILQFGGQPVINTPLYSYDVFGKDLVNLNDSMINILNLDTIHTVGQLAAVYNSFLPNNPDFAWSYSSMFHPSTDANHIYPTIEYLFAQACFQDDCSSQTRKAVLKTVVEKQTYKFEEHKISYTARKTGIFLMACILIKEKDTAFLVAVRENTDLQNALCMNKDDSRIDKDFSDFISLFAINYMLTK